MYQTSFQKFHFFRKFSIGTNRKIMFHLQPNRNFRNLLVNGKRSVFREARNHYVTSKSNRSNLRFNSPPMISRMLQNLTTCTFIFIGQLIFMFSKIYRLLHRNCDVRIFIHELQDFGKRTSERSERVSFPKSCNS